jgi:hypothetical protein
MAIPLKTAKNWENSACLLWLSGFIEQVRTPQRTLNRAV